MSKFSGEPRTKSRKVGTPPSKTPRDIVSNPMRAVTRKGLGAKNPDLRFKA